MSQTQLKDLKVVISTYIMPLVCEGCPSVTMINISISTVTLKVEIRPHPI